MATPSDDRLQLNLLNFYEKGLLTDLTIVAQGREIRCHKMILAANSEWFMQQFQSNPQQSSMEVQYKYEVIKAVIRFMYFGGTAGLTHLGPEDALDMLVLAEDLRVSALDSNDVNCLVVPGLTHANCVSVLMHEGLPRHADLLHQVTHYVGANFLAMVTQYEDQLLTIPRPMLAAVLKTACRYMASEGNAETMVRFCLNHTQLDAACDLLRETKQWKWGSDEATLLRSPPSENFSEGAEWRIENVRAALDKTPARIVVGQYFDWCIRLDYGAEGRLRIVYESATPRGPDGGDPVSPHRCINRFPAAMFAWRVVYRGQDVFNEKPVFICFAENVQLHWSTTLPVSAADLSDDDDLVIMCNMAENPMLSLILYYFSTDLKTTVFSEDILNRLPHIEYRCLSSYSLVKAHVQ
eukprot:TRINITY_DN8328_c0_g1_i1.p1 TRINITY_DN8328_c0_g1~~TRINITY_DN8328_c0_g1_i1.p1  ORF type:complete len:440 (+),score=62.14 TRINITY_DN8328_c0_g1_i1:94-1320(+)